jgi:hypothetical protein
MERYPTRHDVELRLNGTIVKFGNKFYYCLLSSVVETPAVDLYDLVNYDKTAYRGVDANSDKLNVQDYNLGYAQLAPLWCAFFIRPPLRQQKQGLSKSSVRLGLVDAVSKFDPVSTGNFHSHGMRKMLENDYGTLEEAVMLLDSATTDTASVALSRDFALKRDGGSIELYYRTNLIGSSPNNRCEFFTLAPEYNHSIYTNKLSKLGVNTV